MTHNAHPDNPAGISCRQLINSIPVGIYRTTFEGRLVFCNRTFTSLFGFDSHQELIDFPISNLYIDRRKRGDFLYAIMEKGHVHEYPLALKRRNGKPISCTVTARAVLDDDGIVVFIDGIITQSDRGDRDDPIPDLTADREPVEEKSNAHQQLSHAKHQGMVELAGGVAHTLNQPLMIINNLIHDISKSLQPKNPLYRKIKLISSQVLKLNVAVRKIGKGKDYAIMEYISGEKIVDLEKTISH